ncbi:hypothetical protein IV37_GL001201 [Fructilactobacillus fructivorans]|uniref:FtsX-like permease family protein n=1 Tax=Fructilactobacillus fructivorans TaxID=1614 RepID=UPI0007052B16|nr:FtsX-like permease family protein [Fructilactobacillus fructivorans]KRN12424.1 hypothetical protein IV37_GL001201 [Fructilactobacillus fructivorans]
MSTESLIISIVALVIVLIILIALAWLFYKFLGGRDKAAWKSSMQMAFTIAFGIIIAFIVMGLFKMIVAAIAAMIGMQGSMM